MFKGGMGKGKHEGWNGEGRKGRKLMEGKKGSGIGEMWKSGMGEGKGGR